jgi:hypothetical protein
LWIEAPDALLKPDRHTKQVCVFVCVCVCVCVCIKAACMCVSVCRVFLCVCELATG